MNEPQELKVFEAGGRGIAPPVDLSDEKLDLIRRTIAPDLDPDELLLFAEVCKRQGLDPFRRQIYASKVQGRMVIMTSIDGFRIEAERTGNYRGQVGPEWCGPDGQWVDIWLADDQPAAARVGILRSGWPEPLWGKANWKAFNKGTGQWPTMGPHMLAKCAEALGLRKAFPDALGGLYIREELDQAQPDRETQPPTPGGAGAPTGGRSGTARRPPQDDPNRPLTPSESDELMALVAKSSSVNWSDLESGARKAVKSPAGAPLQVKHRQVILATAKQHPMQGVA
jgi:phage recombination protein Bet